jgi:transcriptional regulator with XRE-family HTH domain
MTEPDSEFARQLRRLRDAKGLSRRSLATLTGVSPVSIWKWEHGDNRPRRRFIPSLAKALAVSPIALSTWASEDDARAYETAPSNQEEARTIGPRTPGQQYALAEAIAMAKAIVAEATGTSPNHVAIRIEY